MRTAKEVLKTEHPRLWRLLVKVRDPFYSVPFSTRFVNWIFQRLLRVNGDVPWMVHFTSRVTSPKKITIGTGVWISFAVSGGCYIQGGNGIVIGDGSIFAPGVKIISANHDPSDLSAHEHAPPISIGKDCWIGANAVLLPGVTIGENCVVGAGAVVSKSFPAHSIVAGVPAKIINRQATHPPESE